MVQDELQNRIGVTCAPSSHTQMLSRPQESPGPSPLPVAPRIQGVLLGLQGSRIQIISFHSFIQLILLLQAPLVQELRQVQLEEPSVSSNRTSMSSSKTLSPPASPSGPTMPTGLHLASLPIKLLLTTFLTHQLTMTTCLHTSAAAPQPIRTYQQLAHLQRPSPGPNQPQSLRSGEVHMFGSHQNHLWVGIPCILTGKPITSAPKGEGR